MHDLKTHAVAETGRKWLARGLHAQMPMMNNRPRNGASHDQAALDSIVGKLLTQQAKARTLDIRARRAMFDELARPQREGVTVENVTIGGVPGEWLDTHGADEVDRTIVWLHGGGYVLMSCATHRRLASGIALATGVPVFVPSYRLAPEHPFPAALDDAVAVVSELSSVSHQRKAIILGGDSAGGGLAVSTALRSRVEGINIAALALISPWVDLKRRRTPKAASSAPDPLVDVDELDEFAAMYAGADRDNSLVSPAFANLAGLPPMLIQVGSSETLLSDAGLLAARATEAGVAVRFEEWPAMVHVWHIFDGYLADADRALQQMADWILGI